MTNATFRCSKRNEKVQKNLVRFVFASNGKELEHHEHEYCTRDTDTTAFLLNEAGVKSFSKSYILVKLLVELDLLIFCWPYLNSDRDQAVAYIQQ